MSEDMSKEEESLSNSQAPTQSPPTASQAQAGSGSATGSGSSSGPTSSSQSSGTLSSVETIPVTLASVPEEPEPVPWGRMLPMKWGFRALNCVEDAYLFGRDLKCDYVIGDPRLESFLIYSKKHFRIYREGGNFLVEDLSNNGTFVDGTLVGKGMKHPLVNNSVVSLAEERNRVFVFMDLVSDDQTIFPKEFQEKYLVSRGIGTGVCGEVKLAFERATCKKVAVKIINKKNFPSVGTATRNAEREIEILRRIDHPCLIKTEDFYQTEDTYYIVLELMEGGELFNRVKAGHGLDEAVAKLYFYQMLMAVEYLHRNGIIHRDLKPENILLASQAKTCLIKVTDFNQSKILEGETLSRTLCGTPSYLAPEVFTCAATTGYGPAVDAWSLGVLLFVCLGGYAPFYEHPSRPSVQEQIIQGEFTMVPSKWKGISAQAKDMVRKLLVVDPSLRLSITSALKHPWLQDPAMLAQANKLMYPPDGDSDTELSQNKRPREDEEGDGNLPKKTVQ
ncbi:serine/threonine-protein kinase Chk2 isoform X2 [Gadus chalcogrammus]|uniref:serine/threonine-protein kinase Chk2 isoform X2 n=1 Tax=Gadus chalcogrammus TaxID=1042646 RepID=UPI0024C39269|nr:serine/threonine-protein kinase Chk2 isoform X2 [Gadus chalcogrammus]